MPQAPASRGRPTTRSIELGWSERPGRSGAIPTEARTPASTSSFERAQPLARRRGARLGRPPDVVVDGRHRERDRDVGARAASASSVGVADDQRAARDDRERVRRRAAPRCTRGSAGSGPRRAGTGRSRRRSRSRSPRPARRARARRAQALGDVHLDPDRRAVAVVGRPVGALLERADVTERAAVDAAHVRVERPVERHALDAVQRRPCTAPRGTRPAPPNDRTYVRVVARLAILAATDSRGRRSAAQYARASGAPHDLPPRAAGPRRPARC